MNNSFVNEFDLSPDLVNKISENKFENTISELNVGGLSFKVNHFLDLDEVALINEELNKQRWIPVGTDGIKSNYANGKEIGSYRLSCFDELFSNILWQRIQKHMPTIRKMKEDSPTDWDDHFEWEPIGINPLFRFIRYNQKGSLIPHYDATFIQNEEIRSLNSVIFYLSDNIGGSTRFIKDEQQQKPLKDREYEDWKTEASEDSILIKISPKSGDALIFDHRILHDSEKIIENELKVIMRTDIMYRRVT